MLRMCDGSTLVRFFFLLQLVVGGGEVCQGESESGCELSMQTLELPTEPSAARQVRFEPSEAYVKAITHSSELVRCRIRV